LNVEHFTDKNGSDQLYFLVPQCPLSAGSSKAANQKRASVAVVGLGYVGLPLAVEFGKQFDTIGYDLSAAKIDSYRRFCDPRARYRPRICAPPPG
jgi:hypothetical protein